MMEHRIKRNGRWSNWRPGTSTTVKAGDVFQWRTARPGRWSDYTLTIESTERAEANRIFLESLKETHFITVFGEKSDDDT